MAFFDTFMIKRTINEEIIIFPVEISKFSVYYDNYIIGHDYHGHYFQAGDLSVNNKVRKNIGQFQ